MLNLIMLASALATLPAPAGRALETDLSQYSTLSASTKGSWTQIDLSVDSAGRPMGCHVAVSNGSARLDALACNMLMNSARFVAARDRDGKPIAAVARRSFVINGAVPPRRSADYAIPVDRLPNGAPVFVDVVLVTDEAGYASGCEVLTSSDRTAFDRLACSETTKAVYDPVHDQAGQPVRALREVSVGFVSAPTPIR